ncbi:MAG: TolC family outer membrane protein [Rhodospirillales bacterium]
MSRSPVRPLGAVAPAALLSLAAVVGSLSPAAAQTLNEALASAYATNPTLASARADLRRVDESVPQALAGWRPSADLTTGGGYAASLGSTTSSQQSNLSSSEGLVIALDLRVRQPIYNFVTGPLVSQAKETVKAQRQQLSTTEQTVLLRAATAYLDVLRNQLVLEQVTQQQQQLERDLETARRRFALGELKNADVAQSEASVAKVKAQRAQAEGSLASSRAVYLEVIGRPAETLTLPQLPPNLPASEDEAIARSVQAPTVAAAGFAQRAASDGVDASFGQQLPQFSLQGDAGAASQSVLAVMTVPLFRGGAMDSQVRASKQQLAAREQDLEAQTRMARQQAISTWETYQSSNAMIASDEAQAKAAQIAAAGIRQEASLGLRTVTDVLIAQQQVLEAEVSLIGAKRDTLVGAFQLLAAVGDLTAQSLGLDVPYYDPKQYYDDVHDKWWGRSVGTPP